MTDATVHLPPHVLMLGDCLERMKEIPDGSVDMVCADLPYGITACRSWDIVIPIESLWSHYWRVLKPAGPVVLTAAQPFTSMLVMSQVKTFRYDLVWDKVGTTGFANARRMPLRRHESVLVFYRRLPTYNPIMEVRGRSRNKGGSKGDKGGYRIAGSAPANNNAYYPTSVLAISNASKKDVVHPTQKPVELPDWLIRTYTHEGDTILDNCFGSATTGLACIGRRRRFIGIEKDPGFFDLGRRRMEEALCQATQPASQGGLFDSMAAE